jgi:hypothetical protein
MRLKSLLCLLPFVFLAACAQYEKNVQADENATSIQSINADESSQLDQMSANGQLNSYEEQQMQQAINGQ